MPDITPAQIAAVVGQLIALAVAFGASLTPDQQKALLAVAVTIGGLLLWVDKEIRQHRAENADKIPRPPAKTPRSKTPA